jgi:hypothetical protein
MQARVKITARHREAGRSLRSVLKTNGLDRYDVHTSATFRDQLTSEPVTEKQVADRYALMAEAEAREVYREFRRRQVAFRRAKAVV